MILKGPQWMGTQLNVNTREDMMGVHFGWNSCKCLGRDRCLNFRQDKLCHCTVDESPNIRRSVRPNLFSRNGTVILFFVNLQDLQFQGNYLRHIAVMPILELSFSQQFAFCSAHSVFVIQTGGNKSFNDESVFDDEGPTPGSNEQWFALLKWLKESNIIRSVYEWRIDWQIEVQRTAVRHFFACGNHGRKCGFCERENC